MSKDSCAARCIFILVRLSSLLLLLVGIGVLTDGIYAIVLADSFRYYNTGVLIFGAVIIVTALLGYVNRGCSSLFLLYLTVLFLIFLALGGLTLLVIFDSKYADNVGGETNGYILKYSLLAASAVAMVGVLVACWYRSSLVRSILTPGQQPIGEAPGLPLLGPDDKTEKKNVGKPRPKLVVSPMQQQNSVPLTKFGEKDEPNS